ncbi:hypothetical protein [Humidesulfovibrio sp.]
MSADYWEALSHKAFKGDLASVSFPKVKLTDEKKRTQAGRRPI